MSGGAPADRPVVVLTNVLDIDGNPYLRLWGSAVRRPGARLLPLTKSTVRATGADFPAWVPPPVVPVGRARSRLYAAARNVVRLVVLLAISRAGGRPHHGYRPQRVVPWRLSHKGVRDR